MKKVLAVLLSVMMLLGAVSFSISAATTSYKPSEDAWDTYSTLRQTQIIKSDQVILAFDVQNGTFYDKVNVYEGGKFQEKSGVTGVYYMIPDNINSVNTNLIPGRYVILPQVVAPTGSIFDGWYSYYDGEVYSADSRYIIPSGADAIGVLEFVAFYSPAPVEAGALDGILGALLGVVNKIAALLFPDLNIDLGALLSGLFN